MHFPIKAVFSQQIAECQCTYDSRREAATSSSKTTYQVVLTKQRHQHTNQATSATVRVYSVYAGFKVRARMCTRISLAQPKDPARPCCRGQLLGVRGTHTCFCTMQHKGSPTAGGSLTVPVTAGVAASRCMSYTVYTYRLDRAWVP